MIELSFLQIWKRTLKGEIVCSQIVTKEIEISERERIALSKSPLKKLENPYRKFIRNEALSGVILMISIAIALIWANVSDTYEHFWEEDFLLKLGKIEFHFTLHFMINEFVMTAFFLLVGLEIKRELLFGELRNIRVAILPFFAALGGMIIPVIFFMIFNPPSSEQFEGWAIPMATDIAFALGILYMLGKKIPHSLKIFLASLAIFDDLGSIIVIAVFYSKGIKIEPLIFGIILISVLFVLNKSNVRILRVYFVVGLALWYSLYLAGIHPTLAGVILALFIPEKQHLNFIEFEEVGFQLLNKMDRYLKDNELKKYEVEPFMDTIQTLRIACEEVLSPLQRLEYHLSPLVTFYIIPLFVFANAGITFTGSLGERLTQPVAIGVIAGLVLGKPLGIYLFSQIPLKLNLATLPRDLQNGHIFGAGLIGGIGFTMSTFILTLTFTDHEIIESTKIAILIASSLSGLGGILFLNALHKRNKK